MRTVFLWIDAISAVLLALAFLRRERPTLEPPRSRPSPRGALRGRWRAGSFGPGETPRRPEPLETDGLDREGHPRTPALRFFDRDRALPGHRPSDLQMRPEEGFPWRPLAVRLAVPRPRLHASAPRFRKHLPAEEPPAAPRPEVPRPGAARA